MANLISIGQVLDRTIDHYRKHFGELIGISAWIVVAAMPAALSKIIEPFTLGTDGGALSLIVLVLKNAGGLLLAIVSVWTLITIIIAIGEQATGSSRDITEQGRRAKKLFFPYVWVSILLGLIVFAIISAPLFGFVLLLLDVIQERQSSLSVIGSLLFLAGGLVSLILLIKYSIQYGFAPYSLILDGAKGFKALKHSSSLVKGRWWATFFRFIIPKFIYTVIVFVANFLVFSTLAIFLLFTLGGGPLVQGIGNALWFLATIIISVFLTPLVAVTDYYIYDSLRKTR